MSLLIKTSTLLKVLQISPLQQTFLNIKFEELILQIIANNRHNLIVFHKRYSSNPGVDKHNTAHLVLNEIWPCIQWICIVESYVNFFTVLFFIVIVRFIFYGVLLFVMLFILFTLPLFYVAPLIHKSSNVVDIILVFFVCHSPNLIYACWWDCVGICLFVLDIISFLYLLYSRNVKIHTFFCVKPCEQAISFIHVKSFVLCDTLWTSSA